MYLQECEKLSRVTPSALASTMNNRMIAGLEDKTRVDFVQVYLANITRPTFEQVREAIKKAHTRIGEPNPFEIWDLVDKVSPAATQNEINVKLLSLIEGMT